MGEESFSQAGPIERCNAVRPSAKQNDNRGEFVNGLSRNGETDPDGEDEDAKNPFKWWKRRAEEREDDEDSMVDIRMPPGAEEEEEINDDENEKDNDSTSGNVRKR